MMKIDVLFILLLAANAMLLALACLALVRFERRCRRVEEFWDSPTGNALSGGSGEPESREQMRATQRLEKRLGELQRTVKVIELNRHRPPSAEPAQPATERNLPIENAIRMARLGASVDELTRSCGLNIGEARLMQKLHRQSANTAAGTR